MDSDYVGCFIASVIMLLCVSIINHIFGYSFDRGELLLFILIYPEVLWLKFKVDKAKRKEEE